MPGMTGLELQQVISNYHSRLSIVFISGQGDIPATVKAMKAGAVDFLTKPFEGEVLVAAIEAALRRSVIAHALDGSLSEIGISSRRSLPESGRSACFRPGPAKQAESPANSELLNEPLRPSVPASCGSSRQIRFPMLCA